MVLQISSIFRHPWHPGPANLPGGMTGSINFHGKTKHGPPRHPGRDAGTQRQGWLQGLVAAVPRYAKLAFRTVKLIPRGEIIMYTISA